MQNPVTEEQIRHLRAQVDETNRQILSSLSHRGRLVMQILALKRQLDIPAFDPAREKAMLDALEEQNPGPFSNATVRRVFKEVIQASLDLDDEGQRGKLLVSRTHRPHDTQIDLDGLVLGGSEPFIIAGPCAIEGEDQLDRVAAHLVARGIRLLRGGAYKPRTSPYSFQGLRREGLRLLREIATRHGLKTVTEVVDPRDVEAVAEAADILQIGARNMYNYELLREVGRCGRPVLLKRAFMATLEEFLLSAEYIRTEGNERIILCERGIRSFDRSTRNTLDLGAVAVLLRECHLPIVVDISHGTGRTDIALPLARAALAVGAHGIMLEVHPQPHVALSDGPQSLALDEFDALHDGLIPFLSGSLRTAGRYP